MLYVHVFFVVAILATHLLRWPAATVKLAAAWFTTYCLIGATGEAIHWLIQEVANA